jgi:hypothetical protein
MTRSDVPQVVDPYLKRFRSGRRLRPERFIEHIERLYF